MIQVSLLILGGESAAFEAAVYKLSEKEPKFKLNIKTKSSFRDFFTRPLLGLSFEISLF